MTPFLLIYSIRNQAGLNNYKISVKEWAAKTNAIGLIAKAGRYGGTYCELHPIQDMPDIKADKEMIRRVISNLVSNAIKHTPIKGSIALEAFFREEDDRFTVQVKDMGKGITKEYRDKIFEKFAQVEDEQAKKRARTGFGFL